MLRKFSLAGLAACSAALAVDTESLTLAAGPDCADSLQKITTDEQKKFRLSMQFERATWDGFKVWFKTLQDIGHLSPAVTDYIEI